MGSANATLIVSFSDDANSDDFYMAELDEEGNRDSKGDPKTSFVPNEPVKIIIQHDDTLQILRVVTTNGSIVSSGTVSRTKTETLTFAAEGDTSSLPCLGSSSFSFLYGSASLSVNGTNVDGGAGSYPVVCTVSTTGSFRQYTLTPQIPTLAKDETYDVYIFIYFGPA